MTHVVVLLEIVGNFGHDVRALTQSRRMSWSEATIGRKRSSTNWRILLKFLPL
jgi:hypothetical protein